MTEAHIIVTCPCCGLPMEARTLSLSQIGEFANLSPLQTTIFNYLAKRIGKPVTYDAVVNAMYAERIDGGPVTAHAVLRRNKQWMEAKLNPFGLTIQGAHSGVCGRGFIKLAWMNGGGHAG